MHHSRECRLELEVDDRSLKHGEDPMSVLDRMTRIANESNRLRATLDPRFVLSTFVRQLPKEYSFVKPHLEGQDFDRDEILKRVKARYNSLKIQSSEKAIIRKSEQTKKHTIKVRCYWCQRFGHVGKVCLSREESSEIVRSPHLSTTSASKPLKVSTSRIFLINEQSMRTLPLPRETI